MYVLFINWHIPWTCQSDSQDSSSQSQVIAKPRQRPSLGIVFVCFPQTSSCLLSCQDKGKVLLFYLSRRDNGPDERGEIVTLAEGDTLLAQDVVGSDKVEEDVGQSSSTGPGSTGDVELVGGTDLGGRNGLAVGVGGVLVDALEGLDGRVETRVDIGVRGNVVLESLSLASAQASGQALSKGGDNVDLEGQGLHVRVDRGSEEALRVGLLLRNRDDVDERLDGARGGANGGIVQSERHCELRILRKGESRFPSEM